MSRYLKGLKRPIAREKAKSWMTFLHNHREVVADPKRTRINAPCQNEIA